MGGVVRIEHLFGWSIIQLTTCDTIHFPIGKAVYAMLAMTRWGRGKDPGIWLQHNSHPIGKQHAHGGYLVTDWKAFVLVGIKQNVIPQRSFFL